MRLPHRLIIRPSRCLVATLVLLHLAALLSLVPLPLSGWLKLALAVPLAWVGAMTLRRQAFLIAGASVREMSLRSDGTLEVLRKDGLRYDAMVGRHSTVLPWLVVMRLHGPDNSGPSARNAVILLPDALAAEDYRLLQAWIRWKTT